MQAHEAVFMVFAAIGFFGTVGRLAWWIIKKAEKEVRYYRQKSLWNRAGTSDRLGSYRYPIGGA